MKLKNAIFRRLIHPLRALLKQGMSADRLALCVAIGVVVGNIPILGVSTILCTVIALSFRLNLPAIQLVHAAMAPTQILLIIPYVRLGEWITHAPAETLSVQAGMDLIAQGAVHAVSVLWTAILHAGLAWALTAPGLVLLLYKLLAPVLRRTARRFAAPQMATEQA
jgi:uncharacterized protein (DUF2062 family)